MRKTTDYNFTEFDNGIRLVHFHSKSSMLHMGFFINTGSRDERPAQNGMAHFIEHMVFKGTKKRKSYQIYNRIENIGGELNAFTTKEETCIHTSMLYNYLERASDLISDVVFNSTFPEHEICKEKDIVIDEINYYKDIPEETIFEDFESMVFDGHPLSGKILGNAENVVKFNQVKIKKFIAENYCNENIVISIAGPFDFKTVKNTLEPFFGYNSNYHKKKPIRKAFKNYRKTEKEEIRSISQSHCIIGRTAYPHHSDKRLPLVLLNNLLGGPSSNSLLNMAIREKKGLTYNVESNYTSYSDTGLFSIYFSCDDDKVEKVLKTIYSEINKIKDQKMGVLQLSRAKKQLSGNLSLAFEPNLSRMLIGGKAFLLHNRVDTIEQLNRKIESITSEQIMQVASEILNISDMSNLIYRSGGSNNK